MDRKQPDHTHVNYLYFGALFAFLVFISASSVFTKENLEGSQFFFFFYALGQVILETALFIFIGLMTRRFLNKACFTLFIGGTFTLLILHIIDFMMNRILNLSVWETLNAFIFNESLDNFFYLLDASGIRPLVWILIFIALALVPLIGVFLYKISELISQKKPFAFRQAWFLQAFFCIPCALFLWDFSASKVIHPDSYTAFIKSLPWKFTFLHPKNVLLSLPGPMHEPLTEQAVAESIESDQTKLTKKPNIYLFIVESLREDCITAEIAPHLNSFKNEHTYFDMALSNGNGSHISWFSIFYSQFPYLWNHLQKQDWEMGSPPLNLLKKWGYKINLYSSAQLGYYGMEKLLFGKGNHLVDRRQTFHHAPPLRAADSDSAALLKLQKDIGENRSLQEGQVFIIFWDCTHFDYNWPKNWSPKFTLFATQLAYFQAFHSKKNIGLIKNRYQNAVNYMDHLFGSFLASLPNKEEAIVIVTGDHGEEFFDHGHLFHGSHLTQEQIHVPIYFKFGNGKRSIIDRTMTSQMDIFPSLLDYLSGAPVSFLEGNSLFQEAKWPYVVTARFNAGCTPYEFSIHNGKYKMISQFFNKQDIFHSKQLQILSMRTCKDKSISKCKKGSEQWIKREFGPAFNRLFTGNS